MGNRGCPACRQHFLSSRRTPMAQMATWQALPTRSISSRTETVQGTTTTWTYGYDLGGRLSSVTRNGMAFESYTFDSNDNRLTRTTTTGTTAYVYDGQDRLVSASGLGGSQSRVHDANGDLVSKTDSSGTTSFNYDATGQLLSVTKPGGQVISYELDAGSKRAVKRVNGVVQRKWLYGGGYLPVAEFDADDNLVAVFNGGYMVKNGTTYRLLRDHLGSVRLVVDASTGAVAQRLSYGPWGEVLEDTNPGFQPFGYAGGLYEPDTGLVRFGARDYDPSVGRWTCQDPVRFVGGENFYAYCAQDPINLVDPSGLRSPDRILDAVKSRAQEHHLNYWGGAGEDARVLGNCVGDTVDGQTGKPPGSEHHMSFPDGEKFLRDNGYIKCKPRLGAIATFKGHWGTVVDYDISGEPIIYGRDGDYGIWSGKESDWEGIAGKPEYYYDPKQNPASNAQIQEYRDYQSRAPNGLNVPATTSPWPDSRRP